MSLPVEILVCAILLPVVVSGGLALGLSWPHENRLVGLTPAVAAGFVAGYLVLPWTSWWPEDTWQRVAYLAVAAALVAVACHALRAPVRYRLILQLAVSTLAAWLLVPTWEEMLPRWYLWCAVMATCIFLTWMVWASLGTRWPLAGQLLLLIVTFATAGPVLMLSGNLKFAELTMLLGASAVASVVVAGVRGVTGGLVACAPILAVALPGLLLNGYFYSFSDIPLLSYLLILAAPAACLLVEVLRVSGLQPKWSLAVRLAVALLLPAAALLMAATRA